MDEFNHFSQIADALPVVCGQIVRKTAFECQANIQSFIRSNGQVDTGFMVNSVYTGKDRKSTRLNSSHANISYAVFCLKKKKKNINNEQRIKAYAVLYYIQKN